MRFTAYQRTRQRGRGSRSAAFKSPPLAVSTTDRTTSAAPSAPMASSATSEAWPTLWGRTARPIWGSRTALSSTGSATHHLMAVAQFPGNALTSWPCRKFQTVPLFVPRYGTHAWLIMDNHGVVASHKDEWTYFLSCRLGEWDGCRTAYP